MKTQLLSWVNVWVLLTFMSTLPQSVRAADIFEGIQNSNDYLSTQDGTTLTISGIGTIALSGVPDPTQLNADTVVHRFQDAMIPDTGGTATVNTVMTELQLTSLPGAVSGLMMLVNLTPGMTSPGQITFTQTPGAEGTIEGTFTSFFDVFFSLSFTNPSTNTPVSCMQILPSAACTQSIVLNGSGSWTDDNIFAWLVGPASYSAAVENHVVQQIPVSPEAASLILFVGGLVAVAGVRLRRAFPYGRRILCKVVEVGGAVSRALREPSGRDARRSDLWVSLRESW